MSRDASFEEGAERPLNLGALDEDDLKVIAALVQDAVFPLAEMTYDRKARRFVLLINRFRWEDKAQSRHAPERVQALLAFDTVLGVASHGLERDEQGRVLSLLTMGWEAGEPPAGRLVLTLAGGGAIRLDCEALDVTLKDVTRPYLAPSGQRPRHDA
ncbi:DUF2948 family protein [uncultured Lentibacter sp.]|uniref:DUF2948 family protein n=1 Tax=uncultured Lentibacter sp. TaxID=1659309 RepID=UPI00260A3845|nr:DUF2948 family protein [uncultured Lentibacter sp.]